MKTSIEYAFAVLTSWILTNLISHHLDPHQSDLTINNNKISMRNHIVTFTRVLLAGAAVLITTDGGLSANPRSLSGRNEPRPCSSGEKYKNCCGRVA